MRDKGIRLSPKHGVNPSVGVCYVCGQDNGTVLLLGKLPGDAEAPHRVVDPSHEPCATCKQHMADGVILVSVRDGESGADPYRTGGCVVVTDESIRRIITPAALVEDILRKRMVFVPDSVWRALGLPQAEEAEAHA